MASIEKRGNGRYRLSVVIGYTEDGKIIRERRTIQAKNPTEAKKQLALFEAEILTGQYIKPEETLLRDFYENDWKKKYGSDVLAIRTFQEYVNIIEKRILPKYGHMKLSDIKPIHIVNFLDDLKKDGRRLDGKPGKLSESSIRNCYKAFNSLLFCAHQWKLIKDNPASTVKPPKQKKRRSKIKYSSKTVWELIKCIQNEPFEKQVMFWIAFVTSAREGEIAALEDKHILTDINAILFEQSLTYKIGEGLKIKDIKNNLEGTAAIPKELTTMINKLLKEKRKDKMRMRKKWQYPDNLFLFSNEYGKPIRPDSISQWWIRFIKRNKLEKIRFHDLRHMSITYLVEKNVPMKSISERARHSNIGTTMDIYGHPIIEVDRVAASHFSEFFHKKSIEK